MSKRNLTIGVTVNLKNYESLRLELSDEVEGEEDVRALARFLDQTLALFGQGNAETGELIAHYRRRVLEGALASGTAPAAAPAPEPEATRPPVPKAAAPKPAPSPAPAQAPEPAAAPPEPAATPEPEPEPSPVPAPAAPAPKPAAKPAAKAPAPSPTGAVCEECGAPVTAAEEKTSRLFVSKTLCKRCIQNL